MIVSAILILAFAGVLWFALSRPFQDTKEDFSYRSLMVVFTVAACIAFSLGTSGHFSLLLGLVFVCVFLALSYKAYWNFVRRRVATQSPQPDPR